MKKNTETTTFAFRSKFEKLINDENRPIIMAAFEKFCGFAPDVACNRLWCLTYDEEKISKVLDELGLSTVVSEENIPVFRNELRAQYEKLHPKFLDVNMPCEAVGFAFVRLYNQSDSIVAKVVYEHCLSKTYLKEAEMERILFLLKSDKDSNYFGGIRCLDFNQKEADYLKPFHMQIHALLKEMYANKQREVEAAHIPNTPLAVLGDLVKEAGIDFPMEEEPAETLETATEVPVETENEVQDDISKKEPAQTVSGFICLTPEEILSKKDVFTSFIENYDLNNLMEIGKLGFDLNEVMAKKELIENFLNAVKALSE